MVNDLLLVSHAGVNGSGQAKRGAHRSCDAKNEEPLFHSDLVASRACGTAHYSASTAQKRAGPVLGKGGVSRLARRSPVSTRGSVRAGEHDRVAIRIAQPDFPMVRAAFAVGR